MENKIKTIGRAGQIKIYLGKLFRLFIFNDDWKALPVSALIAGLVAFTVGSGMFVTMEGTMKASLAISCVCIWNGLFNSAQVICRERDIVKREHRSGMYIFSYVSAHAIYQAAMCLAQSIIISAICVIADMNFPSIESTICFCVTMFFLTYAADMMGLMISCIARNTTIAMTIMPFVLIFELLFSSSMFGVSQSMEWVSNITVAKWGMNSMCAQADYNNLPTYTAWNQLKMFEDNEYVKEIVTYVEENDLTEEICIKAGEKNRLPQYECTMKNIADTWLILLAFAIIHYILSILALRKIDKDTR